MQEESPWQRVAVEQAGLISREQLLDLGISADTARARVRKGTWGRVLPGVYDTTPAGRRSSTPDRRDDVSPDPMVRLWTGLLQAGPGAVVSRHAALWLAGAVDVLPAAIQIDVPAGRKIRPVRGISFHQRCDIRSTSHPALAPPRSRVEVAVVDVADACHSADQAIDVVLRSVQRRLTTSRHLLAEMERRARHSRRSLLVDVLADVEVGVSSSLELRYLRDVERAHRLPPSKRNELDTRTGRTRYRDFWYPEFSTVVEVDGREAHPGDEGFRDLRRDNDLQVQGDVGLRYGWRDVAGHPCAVAGQVATVLTLHGWAGHAHSCGPRCSIA